MCVKLHTFCETTHFVQYQSSFFHVSIGKFYTWLNIFTQPAVVMVVTNMKYGKKSNTYEAGQNTPSCVSLTSSKVISFFLGGLTFGAPVLDI